MVKLNVVRKFKRDDFLEEKVSENYYGNLKKVFVTLNPKMVLTCTRSWTDVGRSTGTGNSFLISFSGRWQKRHLAIQMLLHEGKLKWKTPYFQFSSIVNRLWLLL